MQTYTVEQAATALSLDRDTLRRWLRAGRIGGFKAGTDWRLTKEDLDAFVDRNRNSYRPGPPVDEDDDAYWVAEAEAVLDRVERGEERIWTFEEWEKHANALDS